MENGLILKHNTFSLWSDFENSNFYSPVCHIIGKNGRGEFNTLVLASLSPFLKELLSSIPPFVDCCIILSDVEWEDISQFLMSLSQSNQSLAVAKYLLELLGIDLGHFKEVSEKSSGIQNYPDNVYALNQEAVDDKLQETVEDQSSDDYIRNNEILGNIDLKEYYATNDRHMKDSFEGSGTETYDTKNFYKIKQEELDDMFSKISNLDGNNEKNYDVDQLQLKTQNDENSITIPYMANDDKNKEVINRQTVKYEILKTLERPLRFESNLNENNSEMNNKKSDLKLVECDYCKTHILKRNLSRHIQSRHVFLPNGEVILKGKGTFDPNEIVKCDQCEKKLKRYNLNSHLRKSHFGMKPRKTCPYCKKTMCSSVIARHIRNHTENKYVCKLCGERFPFRTNLNVHELMKCGNDFRNTQSRKILKCDKCDDYITNSKQKMDSHKKNKHKIFDHEKQIRLCKVCNISIKENYHKHLKSNLHIQNKENLNCLKCKRNFKTHYNLREHNKHAKKCKDDFILETDSQKQSKEVEQENNKYESNKRIRPHTGVQIGIPVYRSYTT